MEIGLYQCNSIEMQSFYLDGGAMFGIVPKVLWEKKMPPDKLNRIKMSARTLLLRGDGRNILVDTGLGNKLSDKERKIYGVVSYKEIDQKLSEFDLSSDDISDVILTHLHFDHTGGSTIIEDGKYVPTFKKATYYIQEKHLKKALDPSLRDRASFIANNFIPLIDNKVLRTIDGDEKIFREIELIITSGHSDFQQHPLIISDNKKLFFCSDLFPTSAHIPVNWHMGYDNNPLKIIDEKNQILERAVNEKWIMLFEHDPVVTAATLKHGKKGIEIDEIVEV